MNDQPIESHAALDGSPEATAAAEPAAEVVLTADEIKEQMATTRRRIHKHSDKVVTQTKELSDWRFYVKRYPWVSVTAAAVIGYAIVPGRNETGAEDVAVDVDEFQAPSRAEELKSVLAGAAKRAAMAHLRKSLGEAFIGFFTTDDEATPAREGDDDE